ncbi:family 20 glycosylhydrolase [Oscillospiraceae bacterium HV4-5-C5C]|nr:family 20 glycosylhydrolase [Oscillospiraceae bacterium HV4-5-C5C]
MEFLPRVQQLQQGPGCFYLRPQLPLILKSVQCPEPGRTSGPRALLPDLAAGVLGADRLQLDQVLFAARQLQAAVQDCCGWTPSILRQGPEQARPAGGAIVLQLTADLQLGQEAESTAEPAQMAEGYRIDIQAETGAVLSANSPRGLLYGVRTLQQLLQQSAAVWPELQIQDWPDLPGRGFYHDVTRSRVPRMESLKELVDMMSYFKLNELQLYVEHSFLFPGFSEVWRDDTPLEAQDILELDAYCRQRGIELIPSLASFGHLYKVLRTRSFSDYCELDNPGTAPFSWYDRQVHHTIDVTNDEAFAFICYMLKAYMPLFSSRRFNICADETFDLGRGKSAATVRESSVNQIYVSYLKKLCEFVAAQGRSPQFWGDILEQEPELMRELPPQTVCLNWHYSQEVPEAPIRRLSELNIPQYLCPGTSAWNRGLPAYTAAAQNIRETCRLAHLYQARGVLNTDWGDWGHYEQPEFSYPGLALGAALSWNKAGLPQADFNRSLSKLLYGDSNGRLAELLQQLSQASVFQWGDLVQYYDIEQRRQREARGELPAGERGWLEQLDEIEESWRQRLGQARAHNLKLSQLGRELLALLPGMDRSCRPRLEPYLIYNQGNQLFNALADTLACLKYGRSTDLLKAGEHHQTTGQLTPLKRLERLTGPAAPDPALTLDAWSLAAALETWYRDIRNLWDRVSRPSERRYNDTMIFWYADLLRTL